MRKARPREVRWLAQSHPDGNWQSQDLNSGSVIANPFYFPCHDPVFPNAQGRKDLPDWGDSIWKGTEGIKCWVLGEIIGKIVCLEKTFHHNVIKVLIQCGEGETQFPLKVTDEQGLEALARGLGHNLDWLQSGVKTGWIKSSSSSRNRRLFSATRITAF